MDTNWSQIAARFLRCFLLNVQTKTQDRIMKDGSKKYHIPKKDNLGEEI